MLSGEPSLQDWHYRCTRQPLLSEQRCTKKKELCQNEKVTTVEEQAMQVGRLLCLPVAFCSLGWIHNPSVNFDALLPSAWPFQSIRWLQRASEDENHSGRLKIVPKMRTQSIDKG